MRDQEINEAIDIKLGYVACDQWRPFNSQGMEKGNCEHEKCTAKLGFTEYTNFLNPCKYMEDSMTLLQYNTYLFELEKIVGYEEREPWYLLLQEHEL